MSGTYEEWRVTGRPRLYPPFDLTYWRFRNPDQDDPEAAARGFVALFTNRDDWDEGPHLSRRTVTVTEWEPADP